MLCEISRSCNPALELSLSYSSDKLCSSESDLDMEFEGKGKTIKINGATYTQIPNGKNKGRLLDGGVVVDIGPQKYLKWAVREEIENTALTL